ncbi:hypothetical protein N7454_001680 [Penicillium verhagenii]|nr:hypothetical protein N7454_001680 [Penicillium verhagenii]
MSRIHNLPDLRRLASEEYSTALMSLNKALQSPTTAKSDSTLGTVAMLSMYEIVACHDMASGPGFDIMDRWLNHVKGGMRLLELRGVDQLNTTAGVELFTTVRLQTAISGVFFRHNGYNTPSIAAISQVARTRRDAITQPIEDFYNTLIQFNDLAGEVNEDCSNFTVENIGSYIGRALRLDADLRSWAMSLGPDWSFTTVTEPNFNRSDDTQFPMNGGKYHIYNNVNLASMWNHYRQTRIVLHEMIRVLALYLSKLRETSECQHTILASAAISNQMVDDVCSSVRYHFMSDEARFGGAVRLLWPLFLAAGVRDLNPEIKEWIIKILSLISKAMGIQQAAVMSQLLREGRLTNLIPGT